MEPSDDDLISACAAGDRDAFGTLYRRHRAAVYRFALHMTGRRAAAEDIAQEVFLVVIRDAPKYRRGESGCVPWLLGIARNYVRRHAAQRIWQSLDVAGSQGSVDVDLVVRDEEATQLRAAVLALPRVYREAIVLCDLQELSYAEAAEVMGCAIGTVRSRVNRGRGRLAARLRRMAARERGARVPKWIL